MPETTTAAFDLRNLDQPSSSVSPSSSDNGLAQLMDYDWPSSIQLSQNAAIEGIINDIPFFSVGLLAFAVLTLFFLLRRLKMHAVYLLVAVILAFLGAVLDFSQILARGEASVNANLNISVVWPLIVMRELSFSASTGAHFLFFWSFVGLPPHGEARVTTLNRSGLHAGRWENDGIVGTVVKWLLLLGVLAVPILQAVWRLLVQAHRFGLVYYIDNIVEIALSGLFIIKLVVNFFHASLSPRSFVLRNYIPIILALWMSSGIGIANMIIFGFTESTLGRFLLAVEFYILILHLLVAAFYPNNVCNSVSSWTMGQEPSRFETLPMHQSADRVADEPTQPLARPQPIVHRSHKSMTLRLSTWLTDRLSTQLPGSDRKELLNQDQAERGLSPFEEKSMRESIAESVIEVEVAQPTAPVEYPSRQHITLSHAMVSTGNLQTAAMRDMSPHRAVPEETMLRSASPPSPDDVVVSPHQNSTSLSSMGLSDFVHAKVDLEPTLRTDSIIPSSVAGTSILHYYMPSEAVSHNLPSVPDSPIYGLTGAVTRDGNPDRRGKTRAMDANGSLRSSGITNILLQQEELDKSIANLRLFDHRASAELPATELGSDRSFIEQAAALRSHASMSARSDLSLSYFPAPPTFPTNSVLKSRKPSFRSSRPQHLSQPSFVFTEEPSEIDDASAETANLELAPPRMPTAIAENSFPIEARTSNGSASNFVRFVPGGTQYDVTSFIGGALPIVDEAIHSPAVSDKAWTTDDEEPENAMIVTVERKHSSSRPQYVPKPSLSTPKEPALPNASAAQAAKRQPSSLRGGKVGLPPRPHRGFHISDPVPGEETASMAFAYEQPRKAPLVLSARNSTDSQ